MYVCMYVSHSTFTLNSIVTGHMSMANSAESAINEGKAWSEMGHTYDDHHGNNVSLLLLYIIQLFACNNITY